MKNILRIGVNTILIFLLSLLQGYAQNIPVEQYSPTPGTASNLTFPTFNLNHNNPDFNYQRLYIPRTPLTNITGSTNLNKVGVTTTYTNGWGKPLQFIKRGSIANTNDIIVPIDNRSSSTDYGFLPYATTKNSKFKMQPFDDQKSYYNGSNHPNNDEGGYSYIKTNVTANNGKYTIANYSPGQSFVGSNKSGAIVDMEFSTANDDVWIWDINSNGEPYISAKYDPGEILVTNKTADTHNPQVKTYHDKNGKLLCKKMLNGSTWLITYYIYDDLGRLQFILPPKSLTGILNINKIVYQQTLDEFCYLYKYNKYNQLVEKKVPGRAIADRTVYDAKNRAVLYQNALLQANDKWEFYVYDKKGRVVFTGEFYDAGQASRDDWQSRVLAVNNWPSGVTYEPLIDYLWYGFQGTYPSSIANCELDIFNYYDRYSNLPANMSSVQPVAITNADVLSGQEMVYPTVVNNTFERLVGTKVRVKDPNNNNLWTYAVSFYDQFGRTVQVHTLNPWNTNGDWDKQTLQYDFSGNLVLEKDVHFSWTGTNKPSTTIKTKYDYNYNTGQLVEVRQNIDNNGWRQIAYYEYDDMDKLKKKVMGAVEEQNYSYTLRGNLEGINEDYVYDITKDYRKTFGERIFRDYGYTNNRLDSKPAGVTWRGAGRLSKPRSYGYSYDQSGRLTGADFTERDASVNPIIWSNTKVDYTVSNLSYDEGGNILTMNQRGMAMVGSPAVPTPVDIDQLTYQYQTGSNKLSSVTDAAQYNSNDFFDGNTTGADYAYDANGNMITDNNKGIGEIVYNNYDKPTSVLHNSNGNIQYIYSADGALVQKTVSPTGQPTEVYRFWGGFVYKDNELQYIGHQEGRSRYIAADDRFQDDFMVRDHWGNVRTVVTADVTNGVDQYSAGFELAYANVEESIFDNIGVVRDNKPLGTPGDLMSGKLNGAIPNERIGAAILIHAMAGDQLNLKGYGYYEDTDPNNYNTYTTSEEMLNSLTTALTGATEYIGEGGLTTVTNSLLTTTNYNAYNTLKANATDPAYPRAYLNYLVFDEQFDLVASECKVVQLKGAASAWHLMELPDVVTMQTNGYVLAYLSNESNMDVFVDNEHLINYRGRLLEEQHYYPHGLVIEAGGQQTTPLANKFLYQGNILRNDIGLYLSDFNFRQYDQQIGRFVSVDLLADGMGQEIVSPYQFCWNDPVSFTDPLGLGGGLSGQTLQNIYLGVIFELSEVVITAQGSFTVIDRDVALGDYGAGAYDLSGSWGPHGASSGGGSGGGYIGSTGGDGFRRTQSNVGTITVRDYGYFTSLYSDGRAAMTGPNSADYLPGSPDMHTTFERLGYTPVGGEIFDAFNALKYAEERNYRMAVTSAVAMIPYAGYITKTKFFKKFIGKIFNKVLPTEELVQKAAIKAENAIGGKGPVAGTKKHKYANNLLSRYQNMYGDRGLEFNYYFNNKRKPGNRGYLDVIDFNNNVIYDYKFGSATWSPGQLNKYQRNFREFKIKIIRP